jgi:hypothetical protein
MILEESSVTLDIRDEFTSNILSRKINTSVTLRPYHVRDFLFFDSVNMDLLVASRLKFLKVESKLIVNLAFYTIKYSCVLLCAGLEMIMKLIEWKNDHFQVQVMSVASDIETTQSILTSQATAEVRVCGLHLTEFTFIL